MDRYWEATMAHDLERVHELYLDDVVIEFSQSGQRIWGEAKTYTLDLKKLFKLVCRF